MEPVANERRSPNRIVSLFRLLFDQEIGCLVIHGGHLDGIIVIHVATDGPAKRYLFHSIQLREGSK